MPETSISLSAEATAASSEIIETNFNRQYKKRGIGGEKFGSCKFYRIFIAIADATFVVCSTNTDRSCIYLIYNI